MTCAACGREERVEANFCSNCGRVMAWRVNPGHVTRLERPRESRMVAGVCAGLAAHYGWDVSLVRILVVLLVVFTGVPAVAYLAAWIVIPNGPYLLPAGVYTPQGAAGTMSR